MKKTFLLAILLAAQTRSGFCQHSGNVAYGQPYGRARAEQIEAAKRTLSPAEMPPGSNCMFLEASVLMNVKGDEYVAVFGLSVESATVAECNEKMDALVREFTDALKPLGLAANDWFVDFVAQNRIYGYRVDGNVAKEELTGFELKKNVAIRYRDGLLLDKLMVAASRLKIYDLIKVDYIVKDQPAVQERLLTEAAGILKQKAARYEKLLGIKLLTPPQVYAEKPSIHYPGQMYDSYVAYEGERVDRPLFQSKYLIQDLRKARTSYFNPLSGDGFDLVINPVVVEPVVQFTLYLKVKYDMAPRGKK
jgi:uncharacterized protein YggE